jgi:CRP/FNR family transcriptional regulator/CRP/FNR family cyclic AMP-dependent transcriptional regulator
MTPSLLLSRSCFASLGEEPPRELALACRSRAFKRGQALFYEDEPGSALYLLQSGRVKIVCLAPDGGERILHVFGPGDCLGELSLVDGAPRSATAVALDEVRALMLYRDELLSLLQRHPAVAVALLSRLAAAVRRTTAQVLDLTTLDVPGRIARKLLELAERHGQSTPDGLRITLPLTQQELAEMIGATRVAVNEALSGFRSRKILSTGRDGITIHQPEKLGQRVY